MLFTLPRPASVSAAKRPHPLVKPDLSKLVRSTEDALTGIAYQDDAQLCSLVVTKGYATATTPIGVIIRIEAYPPRVHGDE